MKHDHFSDDRIAEIYGGSPLTTDEREFLVTDTPTFEECQPENETALRALPDVDLMRRCHEIWADYCACL